jgi:hypothetical protein
VASEVPHPGVGAPWDGWARYEAAVNRAYAEFPLWGLCAYDTRITPGPVLDDVARTHPYFATADGPRIIRAIRIPPSSSPKVVTSSSDSVVRGCLRVARRPRAEAARSQSVGCG